MQVLHLDSSILGDASASRILTAAIVDELRRDNPGATVIHRDLAVEAIPTWTAPSPRASAPPAPTASTPSPSPSMRARRRWSASCSPAT